MPPRKKRTISRTALTQHPSKEISRIIAALRSSQAEIQKLNTGLEQKVDQRTRELAATVRELEAFSYSVSHDLRAPLRAIDGFSQILLDDHFASLNEDGRHLLQSIRRNTLAMSQLIDDLLTFARVARKDFMKRRVPMGDLAKVIASDLQKDPTGERCRFTVKTLPDIYGDAPLLRQVWTNLLSNAVKFSRNTEKPVIEISAKEDPEGITYRVRDNGAGFDMQFADKLFGVFQRLHSTLDFEGTGVGLAIVQRIILKHGGRVWAEGKPNEGATFSFFIPLARDSR